MERRGVSSAGKVLSQKSQVNIGGRAAAQRDVEYGGHTSRHVRAPEEPEGRAE